jgi:ribA/ribD-fused uncharacterized protein
MKYSKENINPEDKFLFFWGHEPSKDGTLSKSCLSQWWPASFTVDGIEYKTAEHWMMAKKAALFNDTEILEQILQADSPAEAKKLGREVRNYVDVVWLDNRFEIVKNGNYHKFGQNADLREFLLTTQNRILVEASPVDEIWGIGLAADHPDIYNPNEWPGINLLGFALMETRDELKQRYEN